ncbi:MAG: proline--tRNA ligase, partial [Sedimentisphaerales bacterium]|nr:proline--tRNA ligase [Sedimentisphaerales bacterium]
LLRKVASGTYTYLPAGWRVLRKIMAIVREEMDAAGAQEVLLPSVQPMELWQQTGRDVAYGETMARFKDRHGRWNVLAPTAEEVMTYTGACEINSYKQLPINLYQISFKFRDEFRPRFGVLRSREFIMKDAYSFNATLESLEESYREMYEAYKRIFKRCGVPFVIVEAESGEMGGSGSHQFTVPTETGEDVIVYTEDGSYAANIEKAAVDALPKQPAVEVGAVEQVHTPGVGSIEAVCGFMKTKPQEMIKTLVFKAGDDVILALVRGDHELNPEKLTQALGGKAAELADEATIVKLTGAAVGFAGPVGLTDKTTKVFIDHAVAAMAVGVTGANKTDYHVKNVVPGRDFPLSGANIVVADIRNACEGDTHEGKLLKFRRGIEVGQVFKLYDKYSAKLKATFLDENGKDTACLMGCYGIGINRIMASAIETGNDENGIIWPISIAPFEVLITSVNFEDEAVQRASEDLYQALGAQGVEVLLDDRNLRGGVKFKDADLLGAPIRITVGQKGLAEGKVEIKTRRGDVNEKVAVSEAAAKVKMLVKQMYEELNV